MRYFIDILIQMTKENSKIKLNIILILRLLTRLNLMMKYELVSNKRMYVYMKTFLYIQRIIEDLATVILSDNGLSFLLDRAVN